MDNNELLERYTKHDCFGGKVKILVNYIKPSFLFKTKILTPIHLGRAVETQTSKDGVISQTDIKWLHENCEFDDDFEGGISEHNRRIGFLTGTYWAWKNYDKLANPDYFGSFGYRRLLNPDFLKNLRDYDIILPKIKDFKIETIKDQFINYHGKNLYDNMIEKFAQIYPEERADVESYFEKTSGYFDEIYVMRKQCFFDFCEWIFPLLFEFLKIPNCSNAKDMRDVAFIMERVTGYYLYRQTLNSNIKYKEENVITTEEMKVNKQRLTKELLEKLRKKFK